MESATQIRLSVDIAHAEHLIAAGVMFALQSQPDIDVRLAQLGGERMDVDIIVTDHEDGVRLARQWRHRSQTGTRPSPRLMVVTTRDREYEIRQALEAGIHGYVLSNCQTDELLRCVRALGSGLRYVSLAVAQRMADSMTHEALTAREIDVLRLLVKGQCNKSIAQSLDIAVGTVKAHVRAIMGKLDARSRTHAVTLANDRGLVKEPTGSCAATREPARSAARTPPRALERMAA